MDFLRLAFQDPHDRNYCVPIPCRRWHTEQFVDLAKIADRFHMTTVDSEDESILRRDDSQEPLPVGRKCDWNGRPDAAGLRQDAHESNDIRACRLSRKRILHLQADKITGVAERNFRFERQLLEQFSTELRSRYRFTNHKRARRAHIDDIIVAQFSREDTWTKRPVSTNIDTSEENNKSHTGIIWNYPAFVCGTPAPPHPGWDACCLAQCMGSWMASSPVCSWVGSTALSTAVQGPFLGRWRLFGTLPIPGALTGCVSTQRPSCRAQGQPSRC